MEKFRAASQNRRGGIICRAGRCVFGRRRVYPPNIVRCNNTRIVFSIFQIRGMILQLIHGACFLAVRADGLRTEELLERENRRLPAHSGCGGREIQAGGARARGHDRRRHRYGTRRRRRDCEKSVRARRQKAELLCPDREAGQARFPARSAGENGRAQTDFRFRRRFGRAAGAREGLGDAARIYERRGEKGEVCRRCGIQGQGDRRSSLRQHRDGVALGGRNGVPHTQARQFRLFLRF